MLCGDMAVLLRQVDTLQYCYVMWRHNSIVMLCGDIAVLLCYVET